MSKTVYTHTAIIQCLFDKNETSVAYLRKVGKWWETKSSRRRFDKEGRQQGWEDRIKWKVSERWKLRVDSLKRIRNK